MKRAGVALAAALAGVGGFASADVLNVPADYPTIKAGIDAAVDGDEVVVADGTYTGAGNKNLNFHGKLITVRSQNGPAACVIDCQQAGRGFTFDSGEGSEARVQGLTITNGADGGFYGAAIFAFDAGPSISDCVFRQNAASGGGGAVFCQGASLLTLENCCFENNTSSLSGGAVHLSDGSLLLLACSFVGNSSQGNGGAVFLLDANGSMISDCCLHGNSGLNGGAVFISSSVFVNLERCTFSSNLAQANGGGLAFSGNSHGDVAWCEFLDNSAGGRSGALDYTNQQAGSLHVSNCAFLGNSAETNGGAMSHTGGSMSAWNCTFGGNIAGSVGGLYVVISGTQITNCVFWGNADSSGVGAAAQVGPVVSGVGFSCVQGYSGGGPGNISQNPLFVDPVGPDRMPGTGDENLRLLPGSPCIDAGNSFVVGLLDLDGNPRITDDPATRDTGVGNPLVMDMGAYELQCQDGALGDLDCDGVVGVADFLFLLGVWGFECVGAPAPCTADLDGSGSVEVSDMLALLENWG